MRSLSLSHTQSRARARSDSIKMIILVNAPVTLSQTVVAVGVEPDNKLPYNEYFEYFGPDYTLHVEPSNMDNLNSPKDMERIR